jgi:predicted GNAT family N-acyltransferase
MQSIVAYTRVYEERQAGTWHIGRVVVRKDWRLKGLGKKIMNQSINFLFTKQDVELILISAQEYLP